MARPLSQTKPLNQLRSTPREQYFHAYQPPLKAPHTDPDIFLSTTPVSKSEDTWEAADITIRPRTSGGPGDHTAMFHLKQVNHQPPVCSQNQELGSPPVNKSPALLYAAQVTAEHGFIGIALGSPTVGSHWPTTTPIPPLPPTTAQRQKRLPLSESVQNTDSTQNSNAGRWDAPKPKLSRWRSLFRRAVPQTATQAKIPFYQLEQQTAAITRADSHHEDESVHSQPSVIEQESLTRAQSPPMHPLDVRPSYPVGVRESSTSLSLPGRPDGRARAATTGTLTTNTMGNSLSPQWGMLDVSIPDIKMERYSVMFSNVLQPKPNTSSTLLVRRQGNAEKIKLSDELSIKVEDNTLGKRPGRGTSPRAIASSPRLSLFPPTSSARVPSPRIPALKIMGKPLQRSMTTPCQPPRRRNVVQNETKEEKAGAKSVTLQVFDTSQTDGIASFSPLQSSNKQTRPNTAVSPIDTAEARVEDRELSRETVSRSKSVKLAPKDTVSPTSSDSTPTIPPRNGSRSRPSVANSSALSSDASSALFDAPSPLQPTQGPASPSQTARAPRYKEARASIKQSAGEIRQPIATSSEPVVGIARSVSVSRANKPKVLARATSGGDQPLSPDLERAVRRRAMTLTTVDLKKRQSCQVLLGKV